MERINLTIDDLRELRRGMNNRLHRLMSKYEIADESYKKDLEDELDQAQAVQCKLNALITKMKNDRTEGYTL